MPNRMFAYTENTTKPKENPLVGNPLPNKPTKMDNLAKTVQPTTTKPVEKPSPKKHMEENNDNPDLPVPIPQENL